ncbi:hypothetical protein [Actinoplanes sp. NPDC049316]|uniref:hypothetical protein n=1 Tax=Actinoplanes sp. NPDC049316 TaxID=3154727 RepID=UPI0034315D0D
MKVAVVALVMAGLLSVPAPALAAPPDPAKIEAVTEIQDDMWPIKKDYAVAPGEVVPAPLGVQSADSSPVRGLVAQVQAGAGLEFARRYRNCWYTRGGAGEMAWCSFDAVLGPYRTLAVTAPMVAVSPQAQPGATTVLAFRWQSRAWADARGGLREVAGFFAAPGAPVVAGAGGELALEPRDLPTADIRANGNHVQVRILAGPPPSATASPAPTASAGGAGAPGPAPSAGAGGSGATGGLPVTGPGFTLVGVFLLAAGLLGYLTGRRGRNRFVA